MIARHISVSWCLKQKKKRCTRLPTFHSFVVNMHYAHLSLLLEVRSNMASMDSPKPDNHKGPIDGKAIYMMTVAVVNLAYSVWLCDSTQAQIKYWAFVCFLLSKRSHIAKETKRHSQSTWTRHQHQHSRKFRHHYPKFLYSV